MPRNGLLKHCSWEIDRHGTRRVRFRWRKISRYVPGTPGSPEFMAAYARLLEVATTSKPAPVGADRRTPHSLGALNQSLPCLTGVQEHRAGDATRPRQYPGAVRRCARREAAVLHRCQDR